MTGASVSKRAVRRAGDVMASGIGSPGYGDAVSVAELWRSCHSEPLEEMSELLKSVLAESGDAGRGASIVSRLKRMDTIVGKLCRPGLDMRLNTMNDIAGCRVILPSVDGLDEVSARIMGSPCVSVHRVKDYVADPKTDGYRSVHIITRHDAPSAGLSGLYCETQVRTRLQHAWATAVETYDVIGVAKMKFGGGDPDVRRFFLLASGLIAAREGRALPPGFPASRDEARREAARLDRESSVLDKLKACSGSVTVICNEAMASGEYFVLHIDYAEQSTHIYAYPADRRGEAEAQYTLIERARTGALEDVLLVKASSVRELNQAYPNYSTDIGAFIAEVGATIL